MSIKEKVLNMLLNTAERLSVQKFAENLGVSCDEVRECIAQLRKDGYAIEEGSDGCFCIASAPETLSLLEIRRWLMPGEIGSQFEIHSEIDSTNTRARELAVQGAPHGMAVLALRQSAGRGRFGRNFYSPDDSGIYISFILRPQISADKAVMLTPMAAVAVARAMEKVAKVQASVKWVNDVYLDTKKACGVLCEAGLDFDNGRMQYVVAGIGVNVGSMDFPDELREIATSLSNECGERISRSRFCAELINELNALYPQLESGAFMAEYRARSNVIGRDVYVLRGNERYPAHVVDIDDEGSLVVRTPDGQQETLHSGEISLRFR